MRIKLHILLKKKKVKLFGSMGVSSKNFYFVGDLFLALCLL